MIVIVAKKYNEISIVRTQSADGKWVYYLNSENKNGNVEKISERTAVDLIEIENMDEMPAAVGGWVGIITGKKLPVPNIPDFYDPAKFSGNLEERLAGVVAMVMLQVISEYGPISNQQAREIAILARQNHYKRAKRGIFR